jgi:hypothetical protein
MTPEFVRVRDCSCPDTPHLEEGDGVYLSPTLPAEGGIQAEQEMTRSSDPDILTRRWLITFVRYGVTGANYEPFSVDDLLADWALARPVATRAGELYQASVIAPFLPKSPKPSASGRTRATTSARRSPSPSLSESP